MDLQKMIIDELNKKAESGRLQEMVKGHVESMIGNILKGLISGYSGIGNKIQEKLEKQMCKQIEEYNFEDYLPKLENVLSQIINTATLQNKKIIENFQQYIGIANFQNIKMSEIFEKYEQFVSKNVDTSNLEICYDDGVSYMNVTADMENEESYLHGNMKIKLSCEEDEGLTKIFDIRESYRGDSYRIKYDVTDKGELLNLSSLDSFDIFLLQLANQFAKVEKDIVEEHNPDIEVEAEPEASY